MTPTLQGAFVTLRPLLQSDEPSLVDVADGELWTFPFTVAPSAETLDAYLDKALRGHAEEL